MTLRALIVGLILCAVTVLIVSYAELVTQVIMIGFLQLPPIVVALMFLLVLANKLLQRARPGWSLRPGEMAVVYVMILSTSMITSRGLMERLPPVLTSPNYFANQGNQWKKHFFPHIKEWSVPWDPSGETNQKIVSQFYEGRRGEPIPWRRWVRPMAVWGAVMLLVYGAFMCLAALLFRQWAVHERLSFPLVALPIEMMESGREGGFWRNLTMWIGFGVPVFIFGVRGLHAIFPDMVPNFPVDGSLRSYFRSFPLNAVGNIHLYCSFAAIGFFYLLPKQVLFSLWFFYFLGKSQLVSIAGLGSVEGGRILQYETVGAWLALVAGWLWLSRSHLRLVLSSAFGRQSIDSREEILPYPIAFWGLVFCFAGTVWFGCKIGMSLPISLMVFGIYLFVQSLVMARSTSEAGLPMTEGSFRPTAIYAMFASRESLGASNLTALAFFDQMFSRDLRGLLLTGMLDSQRMADSTGLRKRKLVSVLLLTIVVAFLLAGCVQIWLPYEKGGLNLYSYVYRGTNIWWFNDYGHVLSSGESFYPLNAWAAGAGALVTLMLIAVRGSLWWWPFHPLGYALCMTWTLHVFWFPILTAWAMKTTIIRYGGNLWFRKLRPFFLGLIFGEFAMAVFWTVVSAAFDTCAPRFPWP